MLGKRPVEDEEPGSQDTDYGRDDKRTKRADHQRDYSFRYRQPITPKTLTANRKYLKLMSWNVSSLKSVATTHRANLLGLVSRHSPDILFLQETKIQDSAIKDYEHLLPGYESFWNCSTMKKGYSGTAVFLRRETIGIPRGLPHAPSTATATKKQTQLSTLWKKGIPEPVSDSDYSDEECPPAAVHAKRHLVTVQRVSYDFEDEDRCHHGEGRTITVEFDSFILVACYVPNSGTGGVRLDYRVNEWEPHMRTYLRALSSRKPVVFGGDLNCSHLDIDLHDPYMPGADQLRGHTPQERGAFTQLLAETGFRDAFRHFYPDAKGQFTFWDQYIAANRPHNKGVRLDYFLCSGDMFGGSAPAAVAGAGGAVAGGAGSGSGAGAGAGSGAGDHGGGVTSSVSSGGDAGGHGSSAVGTIRDEHGAQVGTAAATAAGHIAQVRVYDSYILYQDTVGVSDHCPIVMVLELL